MNDLTSKDTNLQKISHDQREKRANGDNAVNSCALSTNIEKPKRKYTTCIYHRDFDDCLQK